MLKGWGKGKVGGFVCSDCWCWGYVGYTAKIEEGKLEVKELRIECKQPIQRKEQIIASNPIIQKITIDKTM